MFWRELTQFGDNIALSEGSQNVSYRQLAKQCELLAAKFGPTKQLIFLKMSNDIEGVTSYLASLIGQHTVMLLEPDISQNKLDHLISCYRPNYLIAKGEVTHLEPSPLNIDHRLALLLSTSGSTGTAKQVALSFGNIQANADSISRYLPIKSSDRTLSTLPLYYSYGLSVINSHLLMGATIVFSPYSFVNREFWQLFKSAAINSFAAVPHSYAMLLRLRFTQMDLPSLRYFTQAGGKLNKRDCESLAAYADAQNKLFYVMYGQTEATARMAFLAPELASTKPQSIGKAIPQGQFELREDSGDKVEQPHHNAELFYSGPNVMLGYVTDHSQLSQFLERHWLATGDIAYRDQDNDYFITGRKKRFIKVFGERISLDQVEQILANLNIEAYCCGNDKTLVVAMVQTESNQVDVKSILSAQLKLHSSVIKVIQMDALPLTSNHKKDYGAVMKIAGLLDE